MSIWSKVWDKATDIYHDVTGIPTEDTKRNAARAVNDQIKAYRDQTEISKKELSQKAGEQIAEKRRIEEKQIRSLRRNYRPAGFLNNEQTGNAGMTNKLGG